MAISVPIRDASAEVRYCMTVTGPSTRFLGREQMLIDQMLRVGERVSTLLGYIPSRVVAE
jgi:DNA-binding IclR family transcriptional regulator